MRTEASAERPLGARTLTAVGLTVIGLYVAAVIYFMIRTPYDTWATLFVGPVLFLGTLPVLRRQARREGDDRLFWVLTIALALRFFGSLLRMYVAFGLYGGVADAAGYLGFGARLADRFRGGDFSTGLPTYSDTDFIRLLTAIVFLITGTTELGAFFVFSWLGFLGLFLFYRAFVIAVPEGRARTYARLLFFLPSLIFWPSGVGKDAWMVFGLGIGAYGGARALTGSLARGVAIGGVGLWLASLVRPHVAGLLGISLAAGYMFRRLPDGLGTLRPLVRLASVLVVAGAALVLISQARQFLERSGIDVEAGVATALEETSARTQQGGSSFQPAIVRTPLDLPLATLTVLYRPLPVEANSAQAVATALEGTFLLLLTAVRFRWVVAGLRSVRRQPYVLACVVYTLLFVVAYSSIANFGILTRQRVQVLPVFLVLLAIPAARKPRLSGRRSAPGSDWAGPPTPRDRESGPAGPGSPGPDAAATERSPGLPA